eukprot:3038339-Rhodomonas_salina.2
MMGTYGAPSQVWEAGFNGLYNNEDYMDPVTAKVGMPEDRRETRKEKLYKAKMQKRFERDVISRAEMFKSAFAKFDQDGDGKLSYKEFSKGLQELGVKLPENEMRAIWSEEANGKPWHEMEQHVASFGGQLPEEHDPYHGNDKARIGARSLRIPAAHKKYRSPKVDADQRSRTAVQRKMMAQFAHREYDLKKSFAAISGAKAHYGAETPHLLNYNEYQQCMKNIGALLSEEDLGHLWDTCQRQPLGASINSDGSVLSFEQLAGALGTRAGEPPIVADAAVDKTLLKEKTASLAREKLIRQFREKKNQLTNSFLISDERGTGTIGLGDFKSCLRSAGLLLGEEDCQAVLEACDAGNSTGVNYNKLLSSVVESEPETIERIVSTPASRRLRAATTPALNRDPETPQTAGPIPPYHTDDHVHDGHTATRSVASQLERESQPNQEQDDDAIGQSLQEQLPELKRMVGQKSGKAETDAPVSIWELKTKMAELGVHVDGEDLRNLYEKARVDLQGRIDCDLLMTNTAKWNEVPGVISSVFEAEEVDNPGRRSHPFTPKVPRDPADVSRLVEKIASSRIGNPYKLRTMFSKYDEFPRHNKCSAEEFVQVVSCLYAPTPASL